MSKGPKLNNSIFDQNVTIFIGGLHSNVTEEILWELFLQAGPLDGVRIPKDRETGKQRTFGFVAYQDSCSVRYACELFDQLKLFGKPISCKPQNSTNRSPQRMDNGNYSPVRNQDEKQQYFQHRELMRSSDSYSSSNTSPHSRASLNNSSSRQNLQRSISSPLMHPLLMQAIYQQNQHMRTIRSDWNVSPASTGPMRRQNSMHERRSITSRTQRRQYTHPY